MRLNIRLFYAYVFLNRLDMWIPTVVLFLMDRGLSLTQYAIVDAVWYVSAVVFEIPTGIFTDHCGKKASLLVGALTLALALFLLAFGPSFLSILAAYVLWGFASSFETGTSDALVYDSLKQLGQEEEYRKVRARITTLTVLAGALGSLLAGYLASVRLSLPIFATATIALLACPLVLLLCEPPTGDMRERTPLRHLRESVRYVLGHRSVAMLLLYSCIMGTAVWGLYIFYQPLLKSFAIPVERTGLLYLFFRLSCALGAQLSDLLYRRVGRPLVYLMPAGLMACVLGMGFLVTPWVVTLVFPIFFIEGLYSPILNDLINQLLPSGKRATIISMGSVLACLMGTVLYPVLGRIADSFSLQASFRALGLGLVVCMVLILAFLRRTLPDAATRRSHRHDPNDA